MKPIVSLEKYAETCTCKVTHPNLSTRLAWGRGLFDLPARDYQSMPGDGTLLLIDDENTHAAAGSKVADYLQEQGIRVRIVTLPGDVSLTDSVATRVSNAHPECSRILAVGSGTINDLGKYIAHQRHIPYRTFPTAPSMNGYTSSIAAVKVNGVKRTLPATPPELVYADPDVVLGAPSKMIHAGFCDLLAKSVSDFDWKLEYLLYGGSYCALPSALLSDVEAVVFPHPETIRKKDPEAVAALFKGLLVSGVAMSIAGSSAPASGGEHLVSHFLDMREKITGRTPELHGLQVGAGIVLSAACYRRLAEHGLDRMKKNGETLFSEDKKEIGPVWKEISPEVERMFLKKRKRLSLMGDLLEKHRKSLLPLFRRVESPDSLIEKMRKTGCGMTLEYLGLSREEFYLAARWGRTIRDRITVLDVAAQAGVLEDAIDDAITLLTETHHLDDFEVPK